MFSGRKRIVSTPQMFRTIWHWALFLILFFTRCTGFIHRPAILGAVVLQSIQTHATLFWSFFLFLLCFFFFSAGALKLRSWVFFYFFLNRRGQKRIEIIFILFCFSYVISGGENLTAKRRRKQCQVVVFNVLFNVKCNLSTATHRVVVAVDKEIICVPKMCRQK